MAVSVNKVKCSGCGVCAEACPVSAIEIEKSKAVINDGCVECGACVSECPNQAITISK